jgi:hypothetical protein
VTGRWLLGTGGSGRVAWEAYVRQDRVEAGLELHFPYLKVKPGRGVHNEDVDAYGMLANGELPMLQDGLSWLPGGGVTLWEWSPRTWSRSGSSWRARTSGGSPRSARTNRRPGPRT